MDAGPEGALANFKHRLRNFQTVLRLLRRYALSFLLAASGLMITAFLAFQMDQWCREQDNLRFASEAARLVRMIEQKMERYESGLGRFTDMCSQSNGYVSGLDWTGWIDAISPPINFPCMRVMVVAPKIEASDKERAIQEIQKENFPNSNELITDLNSTNKWIAPVWRTYYRLGVQTPGAGEDLLKSAPERDSFAPALGATYGWTQKDLSSLPAKEIPEVHGFWFVIPLKPQVFTKPPKWKYKYETEDEADQRRKKQRADQAVGLLAAFIDGNCFLEEFNEDTPEKPASARVKLYAGRELNEELLLNPQNAQTDHVPRFQSTQVIPWYGLRWTAAVTSSPAFEAGSLDYRADLVRALGAFLSLGVASGVAWQTSARLREKSLSDQLRIAWRQQEKLHRDLHDGTLQSIFGVGLGLQRARRFMFSDPSTASLQLEQATVSLQGIIDELRSFIQAFPENSRPKILLSQALMEIVGHARNYNDWIIDTEFESDADKSLTQSQVLNLLNIARESLSNSIRHSGASQVQIQLFLLDDTFHMRISDNGSGFCYLPDKVQGHGLINIENRAQELNGSWELKSNPNQGTSITISVPIQHHG